MGIDTVIPKQCGTEPFAPAESLGNFQEIGKALLAKALLPVNDRLNYLNKILPSYIPHETDSARMVIDHQFGSGGKRIRPALYFFCCDLVAYEGEHLYPIAAVCEFVHAASLLHDDVVDSSTLRRNKPTPNAIWGDQASVLVGDLIYSRASEMMAATGSLDIVQTFAKAIRLMSEGELLQLENVFNPKVTEHTYFKVVHCKTSALISASCKSAALLAQVSSDSVLALQRFGECLGTAFQLIDDALDYLGNREIFGKNTYSDLKEGKLTLPVIYLLRRANVLEKEKINRILRKETIEDEDVQEIANLVNRYETAEATIEKATSFTNEALVALENFDPCPARENLETIAKQLVFRSV